MPTAYVKHEKVPLRQTEFNEKWLHDRICEDPTILGLGDVTVLNREKTIPGGGRLDLLLLDEENERRYEVEIQLGATDPSHIVRTIEYWDIERRRYPDYDHVAVIVAENITTRFLNVISLLAGSIRLVAIQLDALRVQDQLLLHFTQVLDLTELRRDDAEEDGGGGQTDRAYWEKKAGATLLKQCDAILEMINGTSKPSQAFNYLRGYIGLQANGVVNNFIYFSPKPTKNYCHVTFRISTADAWKKQFDESDLTASSKHKDRLRISISPDEFAKHRQLIRELVDKTVAEFLS